MNQCTDQQLLGEFSRTRSDEAFAELVRRHINLVHSAAVRMVRDPHLAQDVTQGVFVALAENAGTLGSRAVLSGWLHRTTRNLAANVVRSEVRRRVREQESVAMNDPLSGGTEDVWSEIAPQLDAALDDLGEADRDAVLLRYFERKSAGEMAAMLGLTEDAAQKRVGRAVERLREVLSKCGVTVATGSVAALLSANAVQAAPLGLVASVSSAVALAATTSTTLAATTITLAMTTIQKTLVAAALTLAVGFVVYQTRQAASLSEALTRSESERLLAASTASNELAGWMAKADRMAAENTEQAAALARALAEKSRLEEERERAKRSAVHYKELAERPDRDSSEITNAYPSRRHVMSGLGRLVRRVYELRARSGATLSEEEKKAQERLRLELADEMIQLQKAGLLLGMDDSKEKESPGYNSADMGTCLLYGALDLSEQQFGLVYGLLETIERESKENPLPTEPAAETAEARQRFDDQAKARIRALLTPGQAEVFDLIQPSLQTGPDGGRVDISF